LNIQQFRTCLISIFHGPSLILIQPVIENSLKSSQGETPNTASNSTPGVDEGVIVVEEPQARLVDEPARVDSARPDVTLLNLKKLGLINRKEKDNKLALK
jgi:hypothetical protein